MPRQRSQGAKLRGSRWRTASGLRWVMVRLRCSSGRPEPWPRRPGQQQHSSCPVHRASRRRWPTPTAGRWNQRRSTPHHPDPRHEHGQARRLGQKQHSCCPVHRANRRRWPRPTPGRWNGRRSTPPHHGLGQGRSSEQPWRPQMRDYWPPSRRSCLANSVWANYRCWRYLAGSPAQTH